MNYSEKDFWYKIEKQLWLFPPENAIFLGRKTLFFTQNAPARFDHQEINFHILYQMSVRRPPPNLSASVIYV